MSRHSFQPRKLTFSSLRPVLPHTSGTCSRDLTLYFPPHFPLCTTRILFRFGFPLLSHLPHLHFSNDSLSAPQSPHPLRSLPQFPSLSSPLFHLPPQLTHERAHPREIRAYAYIRTHLHVRRFSFFSFTASPTLRNPLYTNTLGVNENEKKPSQMHNSLTIKTLTQSTRFHPP